MLRSYRVVLALWLAALGALLSACGGGGSSNAKDTLNKAFSTPIKSANVNLDLELTLNGIKQVKGPVKLSLQGPFVSGEGKTIPKVDWDIAASSGGQNFSAGFISTGDNAFVRFQGQNYELGRSAVAQINQQVQAASKKKSDKGLAQFGVHPRDWLTNASDEGTSKVGSVDTDHVSAAFDIGKFLDDLNTLVQKTGTRLGGTSAVLTPKEKQQIQKAVKNPRLDVYVGKSDHVIRRLSADVSFEIPKDQQAQLSGLKNGALSFSIEFSSVGGAQTIIAPKNARPISELTGKLGGLGGALGGGAGTGAAGSSGGASSDALQKYSQCLQKADASKPAELQKCADLLK
jgi:hypothetical protein